MVVTVWNNGTLRKSGAGYGLKFDIADRERFFKREWESVLLQLEDSSIEVEVNLTKRSFWGATCRELINAELGLWLARNGLAPWAKGKPPKLLLKQIKGNRFILIKSNVRN